MTGSHVFTGLIIGVVITVSAIISYSQQFDSGQSFFNTPEVQSLEKLISKRSVPIRRDRDFARLAYQIPEVQALLLGESTHGTSEFYHSRALISQALIEQDRVRFISVEGSWNFIFQLNQFVLGTHYQDQSARELLKNRSFWPHWMWANEEFAEFIDWLHQYNQRQSPENRVSIYGLDIYDAPAILTELTRFLSENSQTLFTRLEQQLSCLPQYGPSIWDYAGAVAQGADDCQLEVQEIRDTISRQLPRLFEGQNQLILTLTEMAEVLVSAEAYHRTAYQGGAVPWNYRARHMADQFLRLLNSYQHRSGLGVYWAHNTHIGDARATSTGLQGFDNIGMVVRQRLGKDNVYLLGQAMSSGEVMAASGFNQAPQRFSLPSPQSDSFDELLEQFAPSRSFIPFHREDVLTQELAKAMPQRAIGIVYSPEDETHNYVPSVIPMRYDGLIYIRETSSVRPLRE